MSDTGNVLDVRMAGFANDKDWEAEYISDLWEGWTTTPEWIDRRNETAEVRDFLYATDSKTTSNAGNPWSHVTVLPKLCQIADNLKAQYLSTILPHDDTIEFEAADEDAKTVETKRQVEGYIRSRHKAYKHRSVVQSVIDDWVEDGNAYVMTEYESQTAQEDANGAVLKGYIGPRIRRIDPARIAFNTSATSFEEAPKIIQAVKTMGDIYREIQNERLPEEYREVLTRAMNFRHYVNSNAALFGDDWLNHPMQGWGTNGVYWSNEHVEILTFYGSFYNTATQEMTLNKKITVIDRKWVLLKEDIDTWDGNPLIRHVPWRKRPNSLLGMGPLANLTGMQYMINHWENSKSDALDKMITQDRVFNGVEDIVQNSDGSTDYYVYETGGVTNLAPDTTILSHDSRIERTEAKMEEYAGVPPEAFGFKTPGEQTKFEVGERLTRGALLFTEKSATFEELLLLPAVNDELELAARHADNVLSVEVSTPEGDIFEEINADVLKRKGSLIPTGASASKLKQLYAQELQVFMQTLQNDPQVALHFPAKGIAKAWNLVLTGGRRKGLFKEFGRVEEEIELAQVQKAAQEMVAEQSSVSTVTQDGLAPQPLAEEPVTSS